MADDGGVTTGSLSYPLTQREQDYLATGETGGYKRGQLSEQIQLKAHRVPIRLEHLRVDLQLLAEGGYIDADPDAVAEAVDELADAVGVEADG